MMLAPEPHTLPFSPPARLAATATSWRTGLRRRSERPADRFHAQASTGGMHAASLLAYLAPLTAAGVSDPVACDGYGPCVVQLAGKWRGRVSFETSNDGIAWHAVRLVALASGTIATDATRCGMWRTPHDFAGRFLRIRAHTVAGAVVGVIAATPLPAAWVQLPHAA